MTLVEVPAEKKNVAHGPGPSPPPGATANSYASLVDAEAYG